MPAQDASYVRWDAVLQFIRDYSDHYGVTERIAFEHLVEEVRPAPDGSDMWNVTVRHLIKGTIVTETYDFVLVCNGHYHTPNKPVYAGNEQFRGKQLHSHDYRNVEIFRDHTVLVIGAGPSGTDLALEASKTAKTIYFSHHASEKLKQLVFPCNVIQVPDVRRLHPDEVDGRLPMPDKHEMLADHEQEMNTRWSKGLKKRQAHMMGADFQGQYYDSLAKRANIDPIPKVMTDMHIDSGKRKKEDLLNYRNDVYRIVDEHTYVKYDISDLDQPHKH
uniref:Flavin-containing monooxygenase n=1 Tax=Anopheles farauti TaxID=69004 RepID=A0A182QE88_9DIPT